MLPVEVVSQSVSFKNRVFDGLLATSFALVSVFVLFSLPSHADTDPGDAAVKTINTDLSDITSLTTTAAPLAEGAVVFGAGMATLKRFIYA